MSADFLNGCGFSEAQAIAGADRSVADLPGGTLALTARLGLIECHASRLDRIEHLPTVLLRST